MKPFKMGRDFRTGEYVSIEIAHTNHDRYEIIEFNKKLKDFRDAVYEPEHIEGGVCWCGVIVRKEGEIMEISHKAQRDVLTDIVRNLK